MTGPEPRIAPVQEPDGDTATLLSRLAGADGNAPNFFTTLAHHPNLLKRFMGFGSALLIHGLLPARERELVILRVAWRVRAAYEWGHHVAAGKVAGLTDAEIRDIARAAAGWPREDQGLLDFVDRLLDDVDVAEPVWEAQRGRWTEDQLVELVMLVGFYRMVAGFAVTIRISPDAGLPGLSDPDGERDVLLREHGSPGGAMAGIATPDIGSGV